MTTSLHTDWGFCCSFTYRSNKHGETLIIPSPQDLPKGKIAIWCYVSGQIQYINLNYTYRGCVHRLQSYVYRERGRERVSYEYISRNTSHACILFGSTHRNIWVLWLHMLGWFRFIHHPLCKRTCCHKIVPPNVSGERMHQCVPAISFGWDFFALCVEESSPNNAFVHPRFFIPWQYWSREGWDHAQQCKTKAKTSMQSTFPSQWASCTWRMEMRLKDIWGFQGGSWVSVKRPHWTTKVGKASKVLYSLYSTHSDLFHVPTSKNTIFLTQRMKINT